MRTVLCSARDLAGLVGEITKTGRPVRFCACGSSMAPAIVPGETVWVAPVDTSAIAPGDIVMLDGPRPVLHRVARIDPRRGLLVTRGDALRQDDDPAELGAVLGRVVQVDRRWLVRAKRLAQGCWRHVSAAVGGSMIPSAPAGVLTPPAAAGGRAGDRARLQP